MRRTSSAWVRQLVAAIREQDGDRRWAIGDGRWAMGEINNKIRQSSIDNPAIVNQQSRNRQSAIGNLQSSIRNKKAHLESRRAFENTPGSDLLSHAVSHAVPSAVEGLTSVFGMGTGVTPLL
jgi:hypothetical protein